MSILWSAVIFDDFRETANHALASFSLTVGEKDDLALFYNVGRRTVERWFASDDQQRRPCMTREVTGKRMIKMSGTPRLGYLRSRCFLPCLLAVIGGIERELDMEEGTEYERKTNVFPNPSLDLALETALRIVDGLETKWLWAFWLRMEIEQTENPRNPWRLVVEYAKPLKYEDLLRGLNGSIDKPEGEEEEEGEYDEYDGEPFQWVWEPV